MHTLSAPSTRDRTAPFFTALAAASLACSVATQADAHEHKGRHEHEDAHEHKGRRDGHRGPHAGVAVDVVGTVLGGREAFDDDELGVPGRFDASPIFEDQKLRLSGDRNFVGGGVWVTVSFGKRRAWAWGRHRLSAGLSMFRFEALNPGEAPTVPGGVEITRARTSGGRTELAYGYEIAFGPRPAPGPHRPARRPMLRLHGDLYGSLDYRAVTVDAVESRFEFETEATFTRYGYEVGPRLGLAAHLTDALFFDFGGFGSVLGRRQIGAFAGLGLRMY